MNIVEAVKQILTECPLMLEFTGGIDVDYTENSTGAFGMFSNGDTLNSTDVIGGQNRTHNFVLYACDQPLSNYERLEQNNFLLNLGYWLDVQKGFELYDEDDNSTKKITGYIKSMSAKNGMMYDIPTGDIKDGVRYQLQLSVEYYLY